MASANETGLHFSNYYIIWNSGYGQWQTWISKDKCLHYDIGGEKLRFNSRYLASCQNLKNELYLTHLDRFHLKFSWFYKKALNKQCSNLVLNPKINSLTSESLSKDCLIVKIDSTCTGQNRFWIGGHTRPNLDKTLSSTSCSYLASLSHHGSSRFINKKNIHMWLDFKMLVTTHMSRKPHHDLKTERLFAKYHRRLIYSYKWGHLIFQLPPN